MKPLGSLGAVLPLVVLGASACGANNSPGEPIKYSSTAVLADFEISAAVNPDSKDPARWSANGIFFKSADTSPDGTQDLNVKPLDTPRINPDGSMSKQALHVTDNGLHAFWGSAWLTYMGKNAFLFANLSDFTGMYFWMKSDGLPVPTVKVALPDYHSYAFELPAGTPITPDTLLPGCDDTDTSVGGKGCYDDYSVKIYPDGQWRRYDIPFSALTTGGWGYPHAFDPSMIFEIKFAMLPEAKYDIWIDDITFYTR